MYIKKIKIENFRSINKLELELDRMNLFYGLNDAGKSNVLKALNLFFNGYTDHNKKYDFYDDFCQYTIAAIKKAKQAPEIKIELTLCYYVDNSEFSWKKVWREEGLIKDELDATQKKLSWARNLVYRYVPAMKDTLFFSNLLTEFYNVFSVSIASKLAQASSQFVNVIQENTKSLSDDLQKSIKINTQVSLPSNLSSLFNTLDFQTENRNGEKISLNNRGDGIKIRHIPSILNFFAEQQNIVRKKGTTKIHTIWGYEEPENNLELKASFEKASQLDEFSQNIQMLITTHSPAFYYLGERGYAKSYRAIASKKGTIYESSASASDVYDSDEGFLTLVAPALKEKIKEINKIKENMRLLENDDLFSKNVLFVEGITDKVIIDHFLKKKHPNLDILVVDSKGCNQVKHNMLSWLYNPKIEQEKHKYIAAALFDDDASAFKARKELEDYINNNDRLKKKGNKYNILTLKTPQHLARVKSVLKGNFSIEIEEIFPKAIWVYADEKNWLEEQDICKLTNGCVTNPDMSAMEFIRQSFSDDEKFYAMYKIRDEKKEKFANYVIKQDISFFDELDKTLALFVNKIEEAKK
ncbi:AAA family ATPase [Actinobacillus equuli]|uniref:AAA family ATPase n=1 Tax=Actinobacillus equuli TaxID=718 RepID=UPI0024466467|nr:AAA family ATPase [Actinobacillus equuli]WGE84265.1 AAA family ATPase [Actinobacillus equuli subsp. equuli]